MKVKLQMSRSEQVEFLTFVLQEAYKHIFTSGFGVVTMFSI